MPVLSSYVRDHAALPRMSANADFSTLLKCLASGKKSIEQPRPSAPRQTSALELLEVYRFRILLVYPCALYYGMLILSRAHGACPTIDNRAGSIIYGPTPPDPYLVSLLFGVLLSLHLVTFFMFFLLLVYVIFLAQDTCYKVGYNHYW